MGSTDRVSRRPLFIGSEIYRHPSYGGKHPLAIPRVSSCIDLCRALGWLPDNAYIESPCATLQQLGVFHTADYLAALVQAERGQYVPDDHKARYNIGVNGNPVHPKIFSRPATACGGTLAAVDLVTALPGVVYHPAGGTHHGRPDRASGFCYLNDPVLGLKALFAVGFTRVLYLDIDAHHCDGVQDAFFGESRILMISIHESGRWPYTGALLDHAGGSARNLPVPPGLNDSEFEYLVEEAVLPLSDGFRPQVVLVQGGCDALADDPLSKLELSNNALWRAVCAAKRLAPRLILLGGGGYNPWSVARCWTGMWAILNDIPVPERLPKESEAVLRSLTWRHSMGRMPPTDWFTTLADRPRRGPIRDEIRAIAATTLRCQP
ncbi:MAG TPA: acetoin utilization protein AcuC [Alphaproteobacteria bacterium]|nr:acetoin utilization protein AcuC [Alphaproteobacteria bacterium]